MKRTIWIFRNLGRRNDILRIAIWEILMLALLVGYRLLGYVLFGR